MKKIIYAFLFTIFLTLCKSENKEVVIIIEDYESKTKDTLQHRIKKREKKTLSLLGIVSLLENDSKKRDKEQMLRHVVKIKRALHRRFENTRNNRHLKHLLGLYTIRISRIEKILRESKFSKIGPKERELIEKELKNLKNIAERIKKIHSKDSPREGKSPSLTSFIYLLTASSIVS